MVSPKSQGHLSLGDSIGLLALALGVLFVVLTPPLWLKVPLVVVCVLVFVFFFHKSHWTHAWGRTAKWIVSIVVAFLIAVLAIPEFRSQWANEHGTATEPSEVRTVAPRPRSDSVFDDTIAEWRIRHSPSDLTLHDLFLTDFNHIEQKSMGAIFVDPARKISVQYAILTSLSSRSKFLAFYISQNVDTAKICASLANDYSFVLDKATQLLVSEKEPGSSGTVSTKEAVFTKRIYVYHETNLDAGTTAKLTEFYSDKNLSVILRSVDYLYTKKLEYRVQHDNVIHK